MGRLGVSEAEARELAELGRRRARRRLVGLMSHFATADEADTAFFEYQLERFTALAGELKARYPDLICHTANSAATVCGAAPRTSTWCAPASPCTGWRRRTTTPSRTTCGRR